MSILAAFAVPHPPLIVPAVGRGEERAISSTIDAYEEVADRIRALAPDTLIVSSPHAPFYRNGFFISNAQKAVGDMSQFRAPEEHLEVSCADQLALKAQSIAVQDEGLPVIGTHDKTDQLDHGTYVPLYFLKDKLSTLSLVRIGLSVLPGHDHKLLGNAINDAVESMGTRAVYIASGDLSHRLTFDGPYGFNPAGPLFDEQIQDIFASGDLDRLFDLDPEFCEDAAECGLRSFQIMAGALEGKKIEAELLSYEGPFGVGYGVGSFMVKR